MVFQHVKTPIRTKRLVQVALSIDQDPRHLKQPVNAIGFVSGLLPTGAGFLPIWQCVKTLYPW